MHATFEGPAMKPTILALDPEGTLISNAISQIPRPGLHNFLEDARSRFGELVMFTNVPEDPGAQHRRTAGQRGQCSGLVRAASICEMVRQDEGSSLCVRAPWRGAIAG